MKKSVLSLVKMLSYYFLISFLTINLILAGTSDAQIMRVDEVGISLRMKEATLEEVFRKIESLSDFRFSYDHKDIDSDVLVSISRQDKTLRDVLLTISKEASLRFRQINYDIDVKKVDRSDEKERIEILIQGIKVSGTVTDAETGEGLPGVNVVIRGLSEGTITDINGAYSLEVPSRESVLVFSSIGFQTREIVVGEKTSIDVAMQPDLMQLSEVVVVGYGVQKKKVATGASVYVKSEDIQKTNSLRLEQALQGQTPGVQITNYSGQPGSSMKVRIRGTGTIGNSEPLYLVDGVPTEDISYLDPSAVERIDVLKDASAAAIYGARASNGVVLITTKKGSAGKARISLNSYVGIQNPYKKLPLLTAEEYAVIMNEASVNSGQQPIYTQEQINSMGKGTDWLDKAFIRNAPISNHSINVSGGSDRSTYSTGLSYFSQEGIMGGDFGKSKYDRITFTINSEHEAIEDIFVFGENLTYSNVKNNGIAVGGVYNNSIRSFMNASPVFPVYDENGDFARSPIPEEANPVANLYYNNFNDNAEDKLVGNVYAQLSPLKGLTLRSSFGVEAEFESKRSFRPVYELTSNNYRTTNMARQETYRNFRYNWDNTLKYIATIGQHNIEVLVGATAQEYTTQSTDVTKEGLIFDDFEHAFIDNATSDSTIVARGKRTEYALSSLFGRVYYNYGEKYLLSVAVRRDGSSNFGKNNLYAIFPSVSAGWVISDEAFFGGLSSTVNFLKLRGSWGQNGNDRIGSFEYMARINSVNKNYYFGSDEKYIGAAPERLANPDLKWETSEQLDFGFEAVIFRNVRLTLDWYRKATKDWLIQAPVPDIIGTEAPYVNGGTIVNKGVEIEAAYARQFGALDFSVSANVAFNDNEVTEIKNSEGIIHGDPHIVFQGIDEMYRAEEGFPVGYFYGLKVDGIFQNQGEIESHVHDGQLIQPDARPGDVRFVDFNNDGVINSDDKTMIGNPNPDMTYGLQLNLGYKGIDFALYTYGRAGHQNVFGIRANERFYNNYTTVILHRWTGEGTSNTIPRVTMGNEPNQNYTRFSELYVEDASFYRIKALSLGYDFASLFDNAPFEQLRLYVMANNLFTFTQYRGMDPEVGFGGTDSNADPDADGLISWSSGIDVGYYPQPRTYSVGLNVKF